MPSGKDGMSARKAVVYVGGKAYKKIMTDDLLGPLMTGEPSDPK
jgi:hypothetical protein